MADDQGLWQVRGGLVPPHYMGDARPNLLLSAQRQWVREQRVGVTKRAMADLNAAMAAYVEAFEASIVSTRKAVEEIARTLDRMARGGR